MEQIEFDYTQPINDEWKKIMEKHLRTAKTFEIHCVFFEIHPKYRGRITINRLKKT